MTTMTVEQEIAILRAENAKLKANATKQKADGISMKVSEKGAVSVYGLGRFPVTLYASQWAKLMSHATDIQAYIEANKDKLAVKGEREETSPVTVTAPVEAKPTVTAVAPVIRKAAQPSEQVTFTVSPETAALLKGLTGI